MIKKLLIIICYCLPALIAISLVLISYQNRVLAVNETIHFYQNAVKQANADNQIEKELLLKIPDEKIKQLISNFERNVIEQRVEMDDKRYQSSEKTIEEVTHGIWLVNSIFILAFALLPFLLFGVALALSKRLKHSDSARLKISNENFIMKFVVAAILCIGWMYILNPQGRGVGTIENYLIIVDLAQKETLPLYMRTTLPPMIAAFLGWYLHLLTYFFTKITHHDVVSANVYNLLFKKFLFVYGIAIVFPATQIVPDEQMSIAMFLLGYFPLTALSLIKEQTAKMVGKQQNEGTLRVIPGISHWQILRMEEEGVDTMAALASCNKDRLESTIPEMSNLLAYWIDIARLYVIVGETNYMTMRTRCMTASGFIKLFEQAEFKQYVLENKLGDPEEICDQLILAFNMEQQLK